MSISSRLADFLRAPSRVAAIRSGVRDLDGKLDTLRSELLYELRYGRSEPVSKPSEKKVLSSEKLRGSPRLNLGCGHLPLVDFVNVDMRALPGVDIIAPVGDLPVEAGTISEIFSSHLLEHFPQEELRRNLLPYWASLLRPGGVFRAIVPDGEAMIVKAAEGSYGFEDFREVLFGSQDYTGDFHFNLFTPESLSTLLMDAGFCDVTIPARSRKNGRCYEFEVRAISATPVSKAD